MAKEGKTKSQKKADKQAFTTPAEPVQEVPEVRPGFWAYVRAAFQLAVASIRAHKLRTLLSVLAVVAVVVLIGWLLRPSHGEPSHDTIVMQVNKELSIQGDANPAILTVVEEDKTVQPFLEEAQNGDKVLLYYKARKSVLFRPSENRIVREGVFTPPEAKIFIRTGTESDTRVDEVKDKLESVGDIDIVSQDASPKSDYVGVTLVSVTDRYDEKIRELEELFDTEVVRLPAGESFPEADILIIVGS